MSCVGVVPGRSRAYLVVFQGALKCFVGQFFVSFVELSSKVGTDGGAIESPESDSPTLILVAFTQVIADDGAHDAAKSLAALLLRHTGAPEEEHRRSE